MQNNVINVTQKNKTKGNSIVCCNVPGGVGSADTKTQKNVNMMKSFMKQTEQKSHRAWQCFAPPPELRENLGSFTWS